MYNYVTAPDYIPAGLIRSGPVLGLRAKSSHMPDYNWPSLIINSRPSEKIGHTVVTAWRHYSFPNRVHAYMALALHEHPASLSPALMHRVQYTLNCLYKPM